MTLCPRLTQPTGFRAYHALSCRSRAAMARGFDALDAGMFVADEATACRAALRWNRATAMDKMPLLLRRAPR